MNRPAPDSPRAGGDRGAPRAPIEQRGERQTTQEQGDHDTIGILALDAHGQLAGACSTSGLRFKVPGRVGDSPIIGHGLYVDPRHGAAVATGAGELVMGTCATFLTVELMRRGAAPLDAAAEALRRITDAYDPQPHHQVALIALAPGGAWASAALRRGFTAAVRTGRLNEHRRPDLVVLG